VNVTLDDDNLLFVDPRLIENSPVKNDNVAKDYLYKFFGNLILTISSGNKVKALDLLNGIEEPKETRLGYGNKNSNGRSAGKKIKQEFIESILNNPVIKARKVSSLSDIIFFVPNMGIDRLSDITTKVIKQYLIDFTQNQCKKLGIPMANVYQKNILNFKSLEWEGENTELPLYNDRGVNKPIIFIPKRFVSREQDANANFNSFFRFARNFILTSANKKFLRNIPGNGKNNTILIKDFDNSLGSIKEELTKWIINYPDILHNYWEFSIDKVHPLSDNEIEEIIL